MRAVRNIAISASIGCLLGGCIVMNEPRVPSGTTPASGETKLDGLFQHEEYKKLSRDCRRKHGEFELTMKVDTSEKPLKILEHDCKPS